MQECAVPIARLLSGITRHRSAALRKTGEAPGSSFTKSDNPVVRGQCGRLVRIALAFTTQGRFLTGAQGGRTCFEPRRESSSFCRRWS